MATHRHEPPDRESGPRRRPTRTLLQVALVDGSGKRAAPGDFEQVAAAISALAVRPELVLDEVPAPTRLATHALAFSADVHDEDGEEIGSGRLVLLHEPGGHDAWGGDYRLVTFVKAEVEADVVGDPLLPGVGWSWLLDSLADHGLSATAVGGTVTQVTNESFGALAEQPTAAELEIRASWTPVPGEDAPAALVEHARAWLDLLCTAAGLAPLPEGVVALPRPRPAR
jgi:hypothetical protein